jgi:hypothetical protein
MPCNDGIIAAITSDCTTQKKGGLEVVAWIGYRPDIDFTFNGTNPALITAIANASTKKMVQIKGVRKSLNSGHEIVTTENKPDAWTHFFTLEQYEVDADAILNVDKLEDVVVIYERKHKTADGNGVFVVRGAKYGLYKTEDSKDENAEDGSRMLRLASMEGQAESQSEYIFFDTNYATTKAAVIALETPGA